MERACFCSASSASDCSSRGVAVAAAASAWTGCGQAQHSPAAPAPTKPAPRASRRLALLPPANTCAATAARAAATAPPPAPRAHSCRAATAATVAAILLPPGAAAGAAIAATQLRALRRSASRHSCGERHCDASIIAAAAGSACTGGWLGGMRLLAQWNSGLEFRFDRKQLRSLLCRSTGCLQPQRVGHSPPRWPLADAGAVRAPPPRETRVMGLPRVMRICSVTLRGATDRVQQLGWAGLQSWWSRLAPDTMMMVAVVMSAIFC
jgi:hypothetical protein